MTKPRYLTISWEQFHSDARALASKLINRKDLKKIICVTRGGLFPAAVLARELEIRWIDTICVVGYDEESRGSHASLLKVPETAKAFWSLMIWLIPAEPAGLSAN